MVAQGGIGLGGILIIVALLYFTGAGAWLWQGVNKLDDGCYEVLADIGTSTGSAVCRGITRGLESVGTVVDDVSARLDRVFGRAQEQVEQFSVSGLGSFGDLASPSEALSRMMARGPDMAIGGDLRGQFQQAVDSYAIGWNYLQRGDGAGQALPWLKQGAAQPNGYGMMSQLALADMYRAGRGAVAADPALARAHYMQAKASLDLLMASEAPEAQQMLRSLPTSPQDMSRQLDAAIRGLGR